MINIKELRHARNLKEAIECINDRAIRNEFKHFYAMLVGEFQWQIEDNKGRTKMTIRDDWKSLRPQLGNFVGKLNDLVNNAENIDEALNKVRASAYNKGYQQGCTDIKNIDICTNCKKNEFFDKYYVGCSDLLNTFAKLHPNSKRLVLDLIRRLSEVENE